MGPMPQRPDGGQRSYMFWPSTIFTEKGIIFGSIISHHAFLSRLDLLLSLVNKDILQKPNY